MGKIIFGTVALIVSLANISRADEQADAKGILDAAIKAQGDEAAQSRFVAYSVKSKGTQYDGDNKIAVTFECFSQGFDKLRVQTSDENGKLNETEVINGKEGWVKDEGQPTETYNGEQLDSRREFAYENWAGMLVPLKRDGFRLSLIDETTVAGRKAAGILVAHDKHGPLKLYFDKETHLLVKYERKYKDVNLGKEIDEEVVCSDYRDVQNIKQPFRFAGSSDGVKVIDLELTEVKLLEKPLDEKLFAKP